MQRTQENLKLSTKYLMELGLKKIKLFNREKLLEVDDTRNKSNCKNEKLKLWAGHIAQW